MEEEKDCGFLGVGCTASDWIGGAVGDAIENLAAAISEALSQMVTTLSTFWVDMPTSNLTTTDGVTASPTVAFLQGGLWYWTAALAVLAVIVGGARMVWEQRGAPIRDLVRSLLTLTLVSGMGLAVIAFLIVAADSFSSWIIDQATDGNGFARAIETMLLTDFGEDAVFLVIILGLIGLLASLIQIVLMVVRSGMLVILAGILPTTAAFTNTETGRQWFQKTIGWTIAFILYKPAAAIVYAVAFRLIDAELSGGNTLLNTITGMALMVVALVALPALLRFVAPMVSAVAGGGGGGMAAGALGAAAMASPSGARSLGAAGRGTGKASPTPASRNSAAGASPNGGGGDGTQASGSPSGSSTTGSSPGGAKPTPRSNGVGESAGPSGASTGVPAMAGAGSGGAATGGAATRAGAAAGPVGMAASAVATGTSTGAQAVKKVSDEAVGEGPSGSNNR